MEAETRHALEINRLKHLIDTISKHPEDGSSDNVVLLLCGLLGQLETAREFGTPNDAGLEKTVDDIAARLEDESESEQDRENGRHSIIKATRDVGVTRAVELVDEALKRHEQRLDDCMHWRKSDGTSRTPNGIYMRLVQEIKQNAATTEPSSPVSEVIKPRKYQEELIDRAKDQNSIVVCHTGTGKTLVSAKVIQWRLGHADSSEKKNVVYLEKTKVLVDQVTRELSKLLGNSIIEDVDSPALSTSGSGSGSSSSNVLPVDVKGYHGEKSMAPWDIERKMGKVMVMTHGIFLNKLQNGEAEWEHVEQLILDECHDAKSDTEHPYTQIMVSYNKEKERRRALGGESESMPYVLGLTATPASHDTIAGTDAQINDLTKLLDAELVYVKDETESLEEHTHRPTETKMAARERREDKEFRTELNDLMSSIEEHVESLVVAAKLPSDLKELAGKKKQDRALESYEIRCENLAYKAEDLNLEQGESSRWVSALLRMLAHCSHALRVAAEIGYEGSLHGIARSLLHVVDAGINQHHLRDTVVEAVAEIRTSTIHATVKLFENRIQSMLTCLGGSRMLSPKIQELADCLAKHYKQHEDNPKNFCAMVRRVLVEQLAHPFSLTYVCPFLSLFCACDLTTKPPTTGVRTDEGGCSPADGATSYRARSARVCTARGVDRPWEGARHCRYEHQATDCDCTTVRRWRDQRSHRYIACS
jgi:superfamily II DNA or RNA helicase